jgi:hypothetical protein
MRAHAFAVLIILLIGISAPAMAANDERYSYITVEDVKVHLDNDTAVIHVNYTVDEGTRFIFFLLGKQDLKNKLVKILNYENAKIQRIDLSNAEFVVDNAAYSYGSGIYWYPSHTFNVVIPKLSIQTPQVTRNFTNINQFPGGIGYFGVASPVPL